MLRENYNKLLKLQKTIDSISIIDDFIEETKNVKNIEYYLMARLLKCDIFIANNMFDQAINELYGVYYFDDIESFSSIKLSAIERLIYVYIETGDYDTAYEYISMKRKYINTKSTSEVNRWYLEMAYVFGEMGNYKKAETYLNSILSNRPSRMIEGLVLSNLTNLYIDTLDYDQAQETLQKAKDIVFEINDVEGMKYSKYLDAKIKWGQNDLETAKELFDEVFDSEDLLIKNYYRPLNDYVNLLIDMHNYELAATVLDRFEEDIKATNVPTVLKDYYRNVIKVLIYRKASLDEIEGLNHIVIALDSLSDKIDLLRESKINQINDRDMLNERNRILKETITKIEQTINFISIALNNDNLRDVLLDFNKYASDIIDYKQATFVIVDNLELGILPQILNEKSGIKIYNYKSKRLYEKTQSYLALTNTVVEKVLLDRSEVVISSGLETLEVKDIVSGKYLSELEISSLAAFPLMRDDDVIGAMIFNSQSEEILQDDNFLLLKVVSRLLNYKFLNLEYIDELLNQKELLTTAIEGTSDGVFYRDTKSERSYFSEEGAMTLGCDSRLVYDDELKKLIHTDDFMIRNQIISESTKHVEPYQVVYRITVNDEVKYIKEFGTPYLNNEGKLRCFVGTIHDFTTQILNEEKVFKLAYVDSDSNLFSKNKYYLDMEDLSDEAYSVAFIELANIDYINQSFSSQIGDQMFIELAHIIQSVFNEGSVNAYRGYGAVFRIIFRGITDKRVLNKYFKKLYDITKAEITISEHVSIKAKLNTQVIRIPNDIKDPFELETVSRVLLNATSGENKVHYYDKSIMKKHNRDLMVKEYLKQEMKDESLEIGFMPIVDIFKGKTLGYETLLYMNGSMFSPSELIKIAEKTSLIMSLDQYVLNRMISQISERKDLDQDWIFGCNVSVKTLEGYDLVRYIKRLLKKYKVSANRIAIEIIESKKIQNYEHVQDVIHQLKELGVKIYLDDFGTRYNSFNYVMELDIDAIKIEKEFLVRAQTDRKVKAILNSIYSYGQETDIMVIFEGLETADLLGLCKEIGVSHAQGYYFDTLKKINEI